MYKTLGLASYCKSFSIKSDTCAAMGTPRECVAMLDDDVTALCMCRYMHILLYFNHIVTIFSASPTCTYLIMAQYY